jgi:hypothetical protein
VEVTGACMVAARSIFVSMFCLCDSAWQCEKCG